jgi:hypothetical protein
LIFARHLMSALVVATLAPVSACAQLSQPATDLTIEVEGDLLLHGGVVTVYNIPVPRTDWPSGLAPSPFATLRLGARYTEVQLRHPAEGTVRYRFRTADAGKGENVGSDRLVTQVLSIIGSNSDNSGPLLSQGFGGANPSGGRIIRIPAQAEYTGKDDATRTVARWGQTERYDAPPPADERSARTLVSVVVDRPHAPEMTCSGDDLVQTCVITARAWEGVTLQWWKTLAETRLERFRDRALRRCYDDNLAKGGGDHCKPDPRSNEPAYVWRP